MKTAVATTTNTKMFTFWRMMTVAMLLFLSSSSSSSSTIFVDATVITWEINSNPNFDGHFTIDTSEMIIKDVNIVEIATGNSYNHFYDSSTTTSSSSSLLGLPFNGNAGGLNIHATTTNQQPYGTIVTIYLPDLQYYLTPSSGSTLNYSTLTKYNCHTPNCSIRNNHIEYQITLWGEEEVQVLTSGSGSGSGSSSGSGSGSSGSVFGGTTVFTEVELLEEFYDYVDTNHDMVVSYNELLHYYAAEQGIDLETHDTEFVAAVQEDVEYIFDAMDTIFLDEGNLHHRDFEIDEEEFVDYILGLQQQNNA